MKLTNCFNALLFILLVSISNLSHSQAHTELGFIRTQEFSRAHLLNFLDGNITPVSDFISTHPFSVTSAILLNENNDVLIYTNGCYIFDSTHAPINSISLLEGTSLAQYCSLSGNVLSESTLFLSAPEEMETSYLFYLSGEHGSTAPLVMKSLHSVKINHGSNIILSNEVIINSEKLSLFDITKHQNGVDYWLSVADLEERKILIYLISKEGIYLHSSTAIPLAEVLDSCLDDVNLRFSPEADKMLLHFGNCMLVVMDFDGCLGQLAGPRINISTASYNLGSKAVFTAGGKYIIINKDVFDEKLWFSTGQSELYFYETDKIGVVSNEAYKLICPPNFSLGRIVPVNENQIYVFNRYSDNKYIFLNVTQDEPLRITPSYYRLPFWYFPSFSRQIPQNNQINNCISSTSVENERVELIIYPNPVSERLFINPQNTSTGSSAFPLKVSVIDPSGKLVGSAIIDEGNNSFDVSLLREGYYFIEFNNHKEEKQIFPFVISR